jgi:hypothetical protein
VTIEFRADSGFAVPALYDYLEEQHIPYTIGLVVIGDSWPRGRTY